MSDTKEKKSAQKIGGLIKNNKTRKDANEPRIPNKKAFEEYAQFIALPTEEQLAIYGYVSDIAFAKAHKLGKNTLSRWKTYDKLWTLRDITLQSFKRYTAQIMEANRNAALKGDTAATKLHLQFIEKWNPKVEVAASIDLVGGDEDFG